MQIKIPRAWKSTTVTKPFSPLSFVFGLLALLTKGRHDVTYMSATLLRTAEAVTSLSMMRRDYHRCWYVRLRRSALNNIAGSNLNACAKTALEGRELHCPG